MKIKELSDVVISFHYRYIPIANSYVPWDIYRIDIVLYNKNYTRHYYDDVTQSSINRLNKVLSLKNNELSL